MGKTEQGLIQRITANIFLNDIYNDGHIVNDGILPRETLYSSANYLENFIGLPSKNIYIHISGSDLTGTMTANSTFLKII